MQYIRECLIARIIVISMLAIYTATITMLFFKREKKHKEEKRKLTESRDYYINELEKRSENENVDLH